MNIVEKAVYNLLANTAAITAIVGTRIYLGQMPQSPTLPALVYQVVDEDADITHDGKAGPGFARIQIDSYNSAFGSGDYDTCRSLDAAVKDAVTGVSGTYAGIRIHGAFRAGSRYIFEDDPTLKLHRWSSDFVFRHQL